MNRNRMYPGAAIVMAGLLALSWGRGGGGVHAGDARPAAQEIAVVDLDRVFKAHKGAQRLVEQLRLDADRAAGDLNAMTDAVKKLKTELDAVKKGSAEFQRIEQELEEKFVACEKFSG